MNDVFEDRQKAFSKKFGQEEARAFDLQARAVKALALWATGKMRLTEAEAVQYQALALDAAMAAPRLEKLFVRIADDFAAHGIPQDRRQVERRYAILSSQIRADAAATEEAALLAAVAIGKDA